MELVILSEGNEHIYIGIPAPAHQPINKMEEKGTVPTHKMEKIVKMEDKVPTNKMEEEPKERGRIYKLERKTANHLCPHCDKKYRRHNTLKLHIRSFHLNLKPFKCDYCDKSFGVRGYLKTHLIMHGIGEKYKCDLCVRVFNTKDSILLHKKQHTGDKSHWCKECGKGFYKKIL